MYCRCRFLCLLLLPAVVVSLHSQSAVSDHEEAASTIKAKVRLVLVDVVVTNGKGDAVLDLEKGDFVVLEDGKPQSVSTFERHDGAPLKQIELPPMPPHVYTNYPVTQSADSVNVLLLDALNTPLRDQSYVHSQMVKYLKTIPPGNRIAIFTLASRLRMLQGITTDSSELLAALNSDKAGSHSSALRPSNAESDANRRLIDFMTENSAAPGPQTLAQAAVDPIMVMKEFLADTAVVQTESRVRITLQALQQLARYLSGVPGRKNVIWFSGSFPTGIFPDSDLPDAFRVADSFQDDIRKTTDLLSTGQVAIYPVAAQGLASDSAFEANGAEIGQKRGMLATQDMVRQMQVESVDRASSHMVMEVLAKNTGGQAFYNTNGLNDALARVVNNGTRYYSLGYSPTNQTMDGKYRRIQVKLVNGKYALAYRRGYYADDLETAQKTDSDPLMPLMGRNLPEYAQILYKVFVQPSNPQPPPDAARIGGNTDLKGPFTRYAVDFAISVEDLKLDPTPDGARHGNIEIALLAYNREGRPLNTVLTRGDVLLKPNVYAALLEKGLQIHKEIDVPKEYVYLRTGVYDLKSSRAGTLGVPLPNVTVPATR